MQSEEKNKQFQFDENQIKEVTEQKGINPDMHFLSKGLSFARGRHVKSNSADYKNCLRGIKRVTSSSRDLIMPDLRLFHASLNESQMMVD